MGTLPPLHPVASLSSFSGTMQFFTNDALMLWIQMESQLTQLNAGVPHSYGVPAHGKPCSPLPKQPCRLESKQEAHFASNAPNHGFSISEWISYAKKKSQIASSTSRLNGMLRARIVQLEERLGTTKGDRMDTEGDTECDPFMQIDPWLNAKPAPASPSNTCLKYYPRPGCNRTRSEVPKYKTPSGVTTSPSDVEPWSSWVPSSSTLDTMGVTPSLGGTAMAVRSGPDAGVAAASGKTCAHVATECDSVASNHGAGATEPDHSHAGFTWADFSLRTLRKSRREIAQVEHECDRLAASIERVAQSFQEQCSSLQDWASAISKPRDETGDHD